MMSREAGNELKITAQQQRIKRAQERARRYLKPGESLVDELLAERRAEENSNEQATPNTCPKPSSRSS